MQLAKGSTFKRTVTTFSILTFPGIPAGLSNGMVAWTAKCSQRPRFSVTILSTWIAPKIVCFVRSLGKRTQFEENSEVWLTY